MATKPTYSKPQSNGWTPGTFVNLYLTESQLSAAWEMYKKSEKADADTERLLQDGYRVTFSRDAKSGGYICTMTCKDADSPNKDYLLSSFAPSIREALSLTLYKHLVVLEGVWANADGAPGKAVYG